MSPSFNVELTVIEGKTAACFGKPDQSAFSNPLSIGKSIVLRDAVRKGLHGSGSFVVRPSSTSGYLRPRLSCVWYFGPVQHSRGNGNGSDILGSVARNGQLSIVVRCLILDRDWSYLFGTMSRVSCTRSGNTRACICAGVVYCSTLSTVHFEYCTQMG